MKKSQRYSTARVLAAACLGTAVSLGASADDVALTPSDEGRYNTTLNQRQSAVNLSGGREIRAGTSGSDAIFEGFMVFDTASVAGPLNSASLDFEIGNVIGSPGSLEVYGVSSAAGFDNTTLTNAQLEAMVNDGGTLIQNLGSPGTVTLNTNVTSFINAQRVAGNSTVGFLFKHTNVTADGTADQIQIWDSTDGAASVTQYPELNLSTVITQPTVAPLIYVTDRSPNGGVDRDLSSTLGTVTATPTLPTTTYEVELDFSSVGGGVETIAFDVDYSQTDGTGVQYNTNGNVGVTGSNTDNYVDDFEALTATATLNNAQTTYSGAVDIRLDTVFTELNGVPNVFNVNYVNPDGLSSGGSGSGSAGATHEYTMPAADNLFASDNVTIDPFVPGTEIALEGLTIELALDGLPDIFSAYYYGDANGDGNVDLDDLSILASNYDQSGKNWSTADFTGDGNVDLDDLSLLATNYGNGATPLTQAEALAFVAAVPEPTSLALLTLGGLLVSRRRRG